MMHLHCKDQAVSAERRSDHIEESGLAVLRQDAPHDNMVRIMS
jgi:hypothetical protein